MRHFLNVQQLTSNVVCELIHRALYLKKHAIFPQFQQRALANLFYENSTRTRVSFELAAKRMGMVVTNIDISRSSESKGEEIRDTVKTLGAMGIDIAVIRHQHEGLPQIVAEAAPQSLHIINAGDGVHSHPSQAMLDFMTILEQKGAYHDLRIAIVGNLKHSRVANSFRAMCQLLGVRNLKLIAPSPWLPVDSGYGEPTTSLKEGLEGADVIVALRIQRERLLSDDMLDVTDYQRDYRITEASLAFAKPDAIVMHPGPINRGVEIDSDVADGSQSCIWQQVQNGVWIRMAIIEHLLTFSHEK